MVLKPCLLSVYDLYHYTTVLKLSSETSTDCLKIMGRTVLFHTWGQYEQCSNFQGYSVFTTTIVAPILYTQMPLEIFHQTVPSTEKYLLPFSLRTFSFSYVSAP